MIFKILRWCILTVMLLFTVCAIPSGALEFEFVQSSLTSFDLPHDLALSSDGRYLYVADNGNDRIAVMNPETLNVIGTIGSAELSAPHDVAFDHRGRLLVADTGNDRVVVYRVNGTLSERDSVVKGSFKRPEGVAAFPENRVYVTGAHSNNLVAFENGIEMTAISGLSAPHDVETDNDGNVLVVDSNNNRLLFLGPDLKILKSLAGPPYDFNGPRYAVYDDAGRIFVADKYANMVKVIGPDGKLLGKIGTGQSGKEAGRLNKPEGVTLRGNDVWISDTYNNRIVRYRMIE